MVGLPAPRLIRFRWKRVFAALALVALTGLALTFASGIWVAYQARNLASEWADPPVQIPLPPYEDAVMCRRQKTVACAHETAARLDLPVAWLPARSGYTFGYLLAIVHPNSETEWKAARTDGPPQALVLRSGRLDQAQGVQVGTITDGRVTATVYASGSGGIVWEYRIRWRHAGTDHELSTYRLARTALSGEDLARLEAIWRTVRYASPLG